VMAEYLRLNGIFWGLTVMELMGESNKMDRDQVVT